MNNKQSNMCQYKNCSLNCLSISHHRYLYAKMNTKPATKIGIPIKKSSKVNWEVYDKLWKDFKL